MEKDGENLRYGNTEKYVTLAVAQEKSNQEKKKC